MVILSRRRRVGVLPHSATSATDYFLPTRPAGRQHIPETLPAAQPEAQMRQQTGETPSARKTCLGFFLSQQQRDNFLPRFVAEVGRN